ncbi:flagellar hook-length control protein FliK [Sphingomonas sp. PB2P12]|uniref:flagellar hook-length control protein FliK n=1 Tax=Sphingomonas sandaracina TaxID=3096157 RepID=UPI002FC8A5D8
MIQTATLSPLLPTQARSTTVPNVRPTGDFAGAFILANDDAGAEAAPPAALPITTLPSPASVVTVRQDAAATGNGLPTPAFLDTAPTIVAQPAKPLPEPPPSSLPPLTLAKPAIPAATDPALPDATAKRATAPRSTVATARPTAFAVSPRAGKAKDDAPTTPSDNTVDAPLADQPVLPAPAMPDAIVPDPAPAVPAPFDPIPSAPAMSDRTANDPPARSPSTPLSSAPTSPDRTAIDPRIVTASADVPSSVAPPSLAAVATPPGETVVAPTASTVGSAKPVGKAVIAAKPRGSREPAPSTSDLPTIASSPEQFRELAKGTQAEPTLPTAIPAAQPQATAVVSSRPRPAADFVDPKQLVSAPTAPAAVMFSAPVGTQPAAARITNPPSQIAGLAAAIPIAPQFSGVILAPQSLEVTFAPTAAREQVMAQPLPVAGLPPITDTVTIATPRWVATDATTPVALTVARPDAVQPQPGTVAPASQVFGAAIQAATRIRDDRDTTDTTAFPLAASAPVSPPTIKTAEAHQAPLDMRQERWPHAMIERIEMLRDSADASDTRIRLIPDALGAIDVSMKTDGDTVHVHFNAEQAATRTLLADAQPRLAELAEARGLKLGQGTLGDGSAGSGQRAPASPQTPNRTAPNRTTTASAMIADAAEDTRIA